MTLDDIAEVCTNRDGDQLSRSAISQWEKVKEDKDEKEPARPSFFNLIAAARKIGASIDYLVGLTDEGEPAANHESANVAQSYKQAGERDKEIIKRILGMDPTVRVASDEKVSKSIKPVKHKSKHK